MAAAKSASKRTVKRSDREVVSRSGSRAISSSSVAERNTSRRAQSKASGTSQGVLPDVLPTTTRTAMPSDRYPYVDPTVLKSAMGRARIALDRGLAVTWDPKKQQWAVPSATDPRRSYRIWKRVGRKGRLPFWVALECNCQAEQSGSYLVCWHKCAVKLRWDEELELRAALRKDVDEPPPDYDEGE